MTLIDFITETSFGAPTNGVGHFDDDGAKPESLRSKRWAIGVRLGQFTTPLERRANIVRLSKSKTLAIAAAKPGEAE